jgi:hypothetical protein
MTPSQRFRLARPVVLVYWLVLLGGLVMYSAGQLGHARQLTPLWIGAIVGTGLGQFLALRDFRLWLTTTILVVAMYFTIPVLSNGFSDFALWKVFLPAALCGFWSLGDRAVLTAFWFPVVLWMLSVLDRTDGKLAPDTTGLVLLGTLALAFFLFLRMRESRRVGLWTVVSAIPLAPAKPAALLKEAPGRQLARAGWGVTVTALTAALTAWIAPRLWQIEALRGDEVEVPDLTQTVGLPCCPSLALAETSRSRVKEYLDLGLGHDAGVLPPQDGISCLVCDDPIDTVTDLARDRRERGPYAGWVDYIASGSQGAPTGYGDRRVAAGTTGEIADAPDHGAPAETYVAPQPAPPAPTFDPPAVPTPPELAPTEPVTAPPAPLAPPEPPTPTLAEPQVPPPAPPEPVPAPAPPAPRQTTVRPPNAGHAVAPNAHAGVPGAQHPRAAHPVIPAIWPWLIALVSGALIFQLVLLGLRPLRRLMILRHLHTPFWAETVDQRVSNAWQLALIGLRDAGWRPDSSEAPRELAARVGVDGVERCAVVLERARHGLGVDADDLSEIQTSAMAAYRSARGKLGRIARAVTWLRWPLT